MITLFLISCATLRRLCELDNSKHSEQNLMKFSVAKVFWKDWLSIYLFYLDAGECFLIRLVKEDAGVQMGDVEITYGTSKYQAKVMAIGKKIKTI